MIDRYVACFDCNIYICAGDRWAYWTLEDSGVLKKGAPISAKAVLAAEGYWNPGREGNTDWLYDEVFPSVRLFLNEHESHKVVFGDKDDFLFGDNDENYWNDYFNWMQIGFVPGPSPRFFVEQLGLRTWDEVWDHVAKQDRDIWWMYDEKMSVKAKRKFEELIESVVERHSSSQ